jgi:hypothetical protein
MATVSGSRGLCLWLGISGVRRGVAGKPLCELRDGCHKALSAEGAFPDYGDPPTRFQESGAAPLVPNLGCGELALPEFSARLWLRGLLAARVLVPEAAVNEADGAVLWKDEIRSSRKSLAVESVPESARMEGLAQSKLRFRVFATDGGHDPGSCCLVDDVCHGFSEFSVATVSRWAGTTPMQAFSLKLRAATSGVSGDPPLAFSGINVCSS